MSQKHLHKESSVALGQVTYRSHEIPTFGGFQELAVLSVLTLSLQDRGYHGAICLLVTFMFRFDFPLSHL